MVQRVCTMFILKPAAHQSDCRLSSLVCLIVLICPCRWTSLISGFLIDKILMIIIFPPQKEGQHPLTFKTLNRKFWNKEYLSTTPTACDQLRLSEELFASSSSSSLPMIRRSFIGVSWTEPLASCTIHFLLLGRGDETCKVHIAPYTPRSAAAHKYNTFRISLSTSLQLFF